MNHSTIKLSQFKESSSPRVFARLSFILIPIVAVGVFFLASHKASAVNKTWVGSGNWSDPNNWGPAGVPASGDIAVFDSPNVNNATINVPISVSGIQINSGYTGTITQAAGQTIDIGNDVIQSGGIFAGGDSAITVSGNLTLSGGTFTSTSGTVTVFGTFTHTAGTFNHNNGTVVFDTRFAGNINVPTSETLKHVTVINSAGGNNKKTISTGDTLIVTGNLLLNSGGVDATSGGTETIEAQGPVTLNSGFLGGDATLAIKPNLLLPPPRPRTISFAAGANLLNVTLNDPEVTINATGTGTLSWRALNLQAGTIQQSAVDFDFGGAYTQSGGTFTGGTGRIRTFNNAFTVSGGIFTGGSGNIEDQANFILSGGTFTSTSGIVTVFGNFTHSAGTFNHNNGTVVFDTFFAGTIDVPTSETFKNLTIDRSNTFGTNHRQIFPGDTLTVTGTLLLNGGGIDAIAGSGTLSAQGNMTVASAFLGGTANIAFTDAPVPIDQTFTNGGGVNPTGTWTINKPSGKKVTLGSSLTLGTSLEIISGTLDLSPFNLTAGPLTIDPGGTLRDFGTGDLTLGGSVTNNGVFNFNGGGTACSDPNASDHILISSSAGTRAWSGGGAFSVVDVDVKDQDATAIPGGIKAFGASNLISNTPGWLLDSGCPVVTGSPGNQFACPGASANFSVVAAGSGLTFKWRKNGTPLVDGGNISGATTATLTINPVSAADGGSYDVVVTNTFGVTATSAPGTLTVLVPPSITSQPSSATRCVGESVTFTVSAIGTGVTFQWRKNGTNIGGANASSFNIASVTTGDAGSYDCVVSGTCPPPATSSAVTLTVNTPPAITSQPTSAVKCVGESVTFTVSATGTALTFQWRKNGTNIGGANANSFNIASVTTGDAGSYDCVVSGTCPPPATSAAVTLTVNTPPAITSQPTSAVKCVGESVTFTVSATGTALTFQWRKNGTNIGGANANSFNIASVTTGDSGSYDCVVSGTCPPPTTSTAVTLTVNTPPAITSQPTSAVKCVGESATFTVSATGTGLTFQWRKNGTNIGGANANSFNIASVTTGDAGSYDCVVSGTCPPPATSLAVTLTVNTPPAITSQPTSAVKCAGESVTFTVSATGTALTFQWRKNGSNLSDGGNISGATTASLTINSASASDQASYDVVITGTCTPPATSTAVTLMVNGYALSSTKQSFPPAGGSGSVNVTTAAACSWTAVSNASFITITGGSNGTGNGTVNFTVGFTTMPRTGTMTVAGQTVTVDQSNPTAINLASFTATGYDNGMLLEWQTGYESDNLGFRLYRQEGGQRTIVSRQLIAGSALTASSTLLAGQSYVWWDIGIADCRLPIVDCQNTQYWLEDVDLKGQSTWHGPFLVQQGKGTPPSRSQAALLSALGKTRADSTRPVEITSSRTHGSAEQLRLQSSLAGEAGVKIAVEGEGWYQVTQPELAAAGFDTKVNPRSLQVFVDGNQLPVRVQGEQDGSFDAGDSVEFYGIGLDTPFTDSHVYWLVAGDQAGLRINQARSEGTPSHSTSFTYTVERRDRNIYFAGLRNGEKENFFGAVVGHNPVDQELTLVHLAQADSVEAQLEVALQGVNFGDHHVGVRLNGLPMGELTFHDQAQGLARFAVSNSILREGANTVQLTGLSGESDISLVDYLRVSYKHSYTADNDALKLTATGNQLVTIDGFTSKSVRVFDVTDAHSPEEILGEVKPEKSGYAVTFGSPGQGQRELIAFTTEQRPASLTLNKSSNLRNGAASFIIITGAEFADALGPLVTLRQKQGLSVSLVDIEDIYDEFSFGQKSPYSVRDFLSYAKTNWKKKPSFVLFAGDASFDPKNYLGFGDSDMVPTKLIDTDFMETSSDDWLSDFNGDGIADIATGRLPGRTVEELSRMVAKIVNYDQAAPSEEALLVADANDGFDFEQASDELRSLIPDNLRITQVNRGRLDPEMARSSLFEALYRKQFLVNYAGHGSVNQWRGNLLTNDDALGLRNDHLPMFVMMTCLNGYFQDPALDSLGESLMKAERGGAVAVWASSGMTMPADQSVMNRELYRQLFNQGPATTVGEAIMRAKTSMSSSDVRRTWVLLGDPAMRLR